MCAEPTSAETGAGYAQDDTTPYVDANGDMTVDFGFTPTYSLGNRVFSDTNNNGIMDGSDSGFSGVQVKLFAADDPGNPIGTALATATTDANVYCRFEDLVTGTYVVVADKANSPSLAYYFSSSGASSDTTLTGDGKDHGKDTPVSVNCAALPAALVESELFGREKGAFTGSLSRQVGRFELADHSTIFLDEVGELPPEVQAKILRVLDAKQIERLGNPKPIAVDVRIIAATNRDLEKAVAEGNFRADLFYRLNVFPIPVPPLRERLEDIPLLVWALVDQFARTLNKNVESIDRESMDALQRYPWPGNIRELRNLIERAIIVAAGPKLRIPVPPLPATPASASPRKLTDVERDHILSTLEESGWRVRGPNGAAARLGLKPTTLEGRMARLGVSRPTATRQS